MNDFFKKPLVKVLMLKGEKGETGDVSKENFDNSINDLTDLISNNRSRIDDAQNGIKTANSRIDNLIVSSGSDSSAEVIDARVGYDGTIYDTLGTAIRTQVNNLKEDLGNLDEAGFNTKKTTNLLNRNALTIDSNLNDDGSISTQTGYCVTDWIDVSEYIGKTIYFSYGVSNNKPIIAASSRVAFSIQDYFFYDINKQKVSGKSGAWVKNITIPNAVKYMRICASYINLYTRFGAINVDEIKDYEEWYAPIRTLMFSDDITQNTSDIADIEDKIVDGILIQSSAYWEFPLLSGVRTDFYYQNRLDGMADKFNGFYCNNAKVHADSISVNPNDNNTNIAYYLVGTINTQKNIEKTNLTIPVKPVKTTDGSGKTKKIILIGDSLTQAGQYQKFANEYFSTDGMSVEWLGTRGDTLKHEGRYGWRAYTYTHFASVTASDNEGTATDNAFWNPSKSKFDFSYYMSNNGFSDVDIVFINLGTNDFARANNSTEEDVLSSWQTMINSIHEYNSNIHIVLWMCPPACLMNGVGASHSANYQHYRMRKLIWDNFTSNRWGKNNIWILPSHLCIDPIYGFPYKSVQRNDYDTTMIEEATDLTHLSDSGYHQLANAIIGMIKYIGSLD